MNRDEAQLGKPEKQLILIAFGLGSLVAFNIYQDKIVEVITNFIK